MRHKLVTHVVFLNITFLQITTYLVQSLHAYACSHLTVQNLSNHSIYMYFRTNYYKHLPFCCLNKNANSRHWDKYLGLLKSGFSPTVRKRKCICCVHLYSEAIWPLMPVSPWHNWCSGEMTSWQFTNYGYCAPFKLILPSNHCEVYRILTVKLDRNQTNHFVEIIMPVLLLSYEEVEIKSTTPTIKSLQFWIVRSIV